MTFPLEHSALATRVNGISSMNTASDGASSADASNATIVSMAQRASDALSGQNAEPRGLFTVPAPALRASPVTEADNESASSPIDIVEALKFQRDTMAYTVTLSYANSVVKTSVDNIKTLQQS